MLPVNLNDLTHDHIQRLIESEVPESLTLEYKQQLPNNRSEEKKEFVYDVAAMANAAGGDLVYGLVERRSDEGKATGMADHLLGTRFANVQDEIIRLSSYIRDGIAPRLEGFQMQPISCPSGDALVIRIPSSWNKPHMVTMDKVDRFYKRTGTTKNQMSIEEIRRAFSEQGELRETIARWRAHRVELIEQKRGPVLLQGEVSMLLHIIPAEAFTPGNFNETWRLDEDEKRAVHVITGNYYQRYNADGFLCHSNRAIAGPPQKTDGYYGYTQLFRSGIVEYAFSHFYGTPFGRQTPLIDGLDVEQALVNCYANVIERYRRQGRVGIVYVGFSMMGIEDKQIFTTPRLWSAREFGIRQNTFTSPEVMVDLAELEERPFGRTLRPLVDTFWQLDGREGTPFTPDGKWNPFGNYQ